MRFIILAPILCLLAIVTAYPIHQARSLEVHPLTFLQTKEPTGGLTPREVTQKIYSRGNSGSRTNRFAEAFDWRWNYTPRTTESDPGSQEAKDAAMKKMWNTVQPLRWETTVINDIISIT